MRLNKAILAGGLWIGAALLALIPSSPAVADNITYTILDLGPVAHSRSPQDNVNGSWGINSSGQVAVFAIPPGGSQRAFLWDDVLGARDIGDLGSGTARAFALNDLNQITGDSGGIAYVWDSDRGLLAIGTLPSNKPGSVGLGINNQGQVVGTSNSLTTDTHPFLWDRAHEIIDMGLPGTAYGINDWGKVTGSVQFSGGGQSPYIWIPDVPNGTYGTFYPLGSLGGGTGTGTAINVNDQICGFATLSGGVTHAFFWDPDAGIKDLGTLPQGGESRAWSLNNSGQVAGTVTFADGSSHAVAWDASGVIVDLNTVVNKTGDNWTLTSARSINDKGWIAGTGFYNREWHAFVLQPSKETQVAADRLHFQTQDQSIWTSGPGYLKYDKTWGVTWSIPSSGILSFGKFWHLPGVSGTPPHPTSTEWGAKFELGTVGKAGLKFHAEAHAGEVNIKYPITVKVQFPDKQDIEPGETFLVTSSFTVNAGALMSTTSPSDGFAWLRAYFQATNRAGLSVKANDAELMPPGLLNPIPEPLKDINVDQKLIDTRDYIDFKKNKLSKDFVYPEGSVNPYIYGNVKFPHIASHGGLDDFDYSSALGTMRSSGQDDFFTINGNVTNIIGDVTGIPFAVDIPIDLGVGSVDINLSLMEILIGMAFGVQQDFQFVPTPHIRFDLPDPVTWTDASGGSHTGTTIEFDAGQSIHITMPATTDPVLTMKPTFSLPNQLTNLTRMTVRANASIVPLEFEITAEAEGFDLLDINKKLGEADWSSKIEPILTLFNNTFTVGGFKSFPSSPVTIVSSKHHAATLDQASPDHATMFIADVSHASLSLSAFKKLVAGTTLISLSGSNFSSKAKAHFDYYGAHLDLATKYVSKTKLQAKLPNRLFLLPGNGRLTVTDNGNLSNSLDFTVNYPSPNLTGVAPNMFAADPNIKDAALGVTGNNFIYRPDYFWQASSKYPTRLIQKFWNTVFPHDPLMPAYFPDFPYFDTDSGGAPLTSPALAPMPTLYWNEDPFLLYTGSKPSNFQPALLPADAFQTSHLVQAYLVNPPPGGGNSNSVQALIAAPQPSINALRPASALPGSAALTLNITGDSVIPADPHNITDTSARGFVANSVVYWNNQPLTTRFFSTTQLQADVPASYLTNAGTVNITVQNPWTDATGKTGTYTSSAVTFTIGLPTPTILKLLPAECVTYDALFAPRPSDQPQYNFVVKGTGFVSGATIYWNGSPRSTQYVSDTQLTAVLSQSDVATSGTYNVTVANPAGATSSAATFTVKDLLQDLTLDKNTVFPGQTATGTVTLAKAQVADTLINLSSANSAAPVPSTVKVLAGATTATFTITAGAVSSVTTGNITASYSGVSKTKAFTVNPIGVKKLSLSATTIQGGKSVTGTITLSSAAAPSDLTVTFSSDKGGITFTTTSLTITKGKTTGTVTISTSAVAANTVVTITATLNGISQSVQLTVTP